MKSISKNILPLFIVVVFMVSGFQFPATLNGGPADCDVDTTHIAVVELTVLGMDSITVTEVQDRLDETCGVSFNFACWADTVVFIEYDSVLTDSGHLMAVIEQLGYKSKVKLHY